MNRLKNILLAGTLVPALVVAPLVGALAQIPPLPDEKRPPHAGAEGKPPAAREAPKAAIPREAPKVAPPVTKEVPKAVAPATREVPRAAPKVEAPKAEAPQIERPKAVVPKAAVPKAEAPKAAIPKVEAPKTERLRAEPPKAEAPAKAVPKVEAPTKVVPKAATAPANRLAPTAAEKREMPAEKRNAPAATQAPPQRQATPGAAPAAAPAPNAAPPHAGQPGAHPNAAAPGTHNNAAAPAAATAPPNAGTPNAERGPRGERGAAGAPGAAGAAGAPGAPGAAGAPGAPGVNPNVRQGGGIGLGGAAAIGAAAGFAGGFIAATAGAQHLDQIRNERRVVNENGQTFIREPGRTIVEDGDQSFIVHDENDRFRELGYNVRRERSGRDMIDVIDRPGGIQILTFSDPDGRMLRRVRRYPDGHEVVLIDNGFEGRVRPPSDDIVVLPPPPLEIPPNRYAVDYADANEGLIYETFEAPPLRAPPRRYTLDQIRYSPDIRRYVRSVDINTINFDSGSWTVPAAATGKLQALAGAIKRTTDRNPNAVFLVEGYTDATGNPTDNLSLSDRRAQSVAAILSKDFGVPPENLTTQGYGQQNLKENTPGPSSANRRVLVQNITPLLAAGGAPPR